MVSPWEEAKDLVSTIVRETTEENHHPPSFHWLGDHTQISMGLKELDWMPHVNLIEELVQLTDVIAKANTNTEELMSSLASQMELFYTSTNAQLASLYYYCNTTLRRNMNEQILLAVDKSYAQLVLAVIGCIKTMESLQIALGSLPDILQVAYVRDIPNPTLFSIDEYLNDDNDMQDLYANESSDDTDAETSEILNDRSTDFQGNRCNSLQEARAGFLRLVMGEDSTNDPSESTANIEPSNPSRSLNTEEFLWSLGEQDEIEQKSETQESNSLNSSAVTSLLSDTPKSNKRSSTNRQFGNTNLRKHQQQQQQKQQEQHQQRPSHVDIPRTIAQHPLLPHRLHTLFQTTSEATKIKIDGRKKRPRNNLSEEPKDSPLPSAKRSRTTLEANASKMQKQFLSLVDQIVSSNFVEKIENATIDNKENFMKKQELSEVDSFVTMNKENLQTESHSSLNITEGKTITPEASPKNITGQIFNESIRPKAGFYKEIDEVHDKLLKDVTPNLDEKTQPSAKIGQRAKIKESDISKSGKEKLKKSTETKSKKSRGRPRKVKK